MENQQITDLVLASSTHSTMMLTNDQLEGIVASALRKQAEGTNSQIEELHTQINSMKVKLSTHPQQKNSGVPRKAASSTSNTLTRTRNLPVNSLPNKRAQLILQTDTPRHVQCAQSEPLGNKSSPSANPFEGPSCKISFAPPVTPKCDPNQLQTSDLPQDYQSTKNCLFIHIHLLWGLIEQSSIPALPPPTIISEFENQFSSIKQILDLDISSSALEIISQADVQTLWDGRSEKIKMSRGLLHIPEDLIWYVHVHFVKLGIRCWGPNLAEGPESLFNSSMCIAALSTFRMFASHGAYDFLKINYSQARTEFAILSNLPTCYQKIIMDVSAHSNDEEDPERDIYIIKTLCYCSNAVNVFFLRLNVEMEKANLASGKKSRKRTCRLPKEKVISHIQKPPKDLPLDFYNCKWLLNLPINQHRSIPDVNNVAFIPDPSRSFLPSRHPDHNPNEKLSDKNFNRKFLDEVMTKYGFAEQEENFEEEEDENDEGMVGVDGSIDLEATSPEDFEDDLYGVREWGNAYNLEDDEDWGGDDGNWKSNGSDSAEDEEGEDMYDDI
ncbi:hypothetical protein CROQUDRAFT_89135 [Cronartium quercuum f. sp. fusiforme G11]|uniref:Uncharacterized protein n=1 Tax=Cronartium quercuum f. sp. fusiforme G11 TaxID=708437 RepID=A0A9P6NSB8_9BASI|nr:hypothetical protein CROQUDRAFT_89135 [Cronartium quercuum f. sp. fusiforme G11]